MTQDLARQTGGDVEHATSTTGFTDAVIATLGHASVDRCRSVRPVGPAPTPLPGWNYRPARDAGIVRRTVGIDIFIATGLAPDVLGPDLERIASAGPFELQMISSRGTKVYPPTGLRPDSVGLSGRAS